MRNHVCFKSKLRRTSRSNDDQACHPLNCTLIEGDVVAPLWLNTGIPGVWLEHKTLTECACTDKKCMFVNHTPLKNLLSCFDNTTMACCLVTKVTNNRIIIVPCIPHSETQSVYLNAVNKMIRYTNYKCCTELHTKDPFTCFQPITIATNQVCGFAVTLRKTLWKLPYTFYKHKNTVQLIKSPIDKPLSEQFVKRCTKYITHSVKTE